jgi:3-hydroxybutyryl-CoA dehydrogenase
VPARQSGEEAIQQAEAFWRTLELDPVRVQDGVAGVVPRVVCNLVNEAAYALQEGVASAEDIDRAMQLGTNWPRGPLAWGDLIGPQTVVEVIEALGREYGTDVYHPAPLLRQMARADERFHSE